MRSGVPFQDELIRFAEVALGDNEAEISEARQELRDKLGDEAVVDAASVIANFQRMVRIADGAGIPLDTPMAVVTAPMRAELGLDSYGASSNTPALSMLQKILGRIINPFLPVLFKQITRRMSSTEQAAPD
ncbi:MAG: hypothetical protein IIB71_17115 [Proteobacteria bacterium]|nr:hypothetical protein [Pseudomonadota bacterium]